MDGGIDMNIQRRKIAWFLIIMFIMVDVLRITDQWGITMDREVQAQTVLSVVYWNPNNTDELTVDGEIKKYAGKDTNTGTAPESPVYTLDKAISLAAEGATIYCMNQWSIAADENVTISGLVGEVDKNITIERYASYIGNLFAVAAGASLTLDSVAISPGTDTGSRVIKIEEGGELFIGENVSIEEQGEIFFAGTGSNVTTLKVTATTLAGKSYLLGYEKTPAKGSVVIEVAADIGNPMDYFLFAASITDTLHLEEKTAGKLAFYENAVYENVIYLSGTGSDDNSGAAANSAVKTFARAKKLMKTQCGNQGTIYICGTVNITEEETWDLGEAKDTIIVKNSPSFTSSSLVNITTTGKLTLQNITIEQKITRAFYAFAVSGVL